MVEGVARGAWLGLLSVAAVFGALVLTVSLAPVDSTAANKDFGQRQDDHRGERQSGNSVLDRREEPDHFCVPARCCLR